MRSKNRRFSSKDRGWEERRVVVQIYYRALVHLRWVPKVDDLQGRIERSSVHYDTKSLTYKIKSVDFTFLARDILSLMPITRHGEGEAVLARFKELELSSRAFGPGSYMRSNEPLLIQPNARVEDEWRYGRGKARPGGISCSCLASVSESSSERKDRGSRLKI